MKHKKVENMSKFDALIRHYTNETGLQGARFSLPSLYDEAVILAEKLEKNGDLKMGKDAVCLIPMENGDYVRFTFDRDFVRAEKIDVKTGKTTDLVTPTINKNKSVNYELMLEYTEKLKESGFGIGPRFEEELRKVLSDAKVGEILIADNGRGFVVTDKNDKAGQISLLQMSGKGIVPTIENFNRQRTNVISIKNDLSVQTFYRALRDKYDDHVSGRITDTKSVNELYEKIERRISDYAGEISLGPNKFKVIKGETGLIWFDEKGTKYNEQIIKPMLAWLSNAPVDVTYTNADKSENAVISDMNERAELIDAFSKGNLALGLARAEEYCRSNNKSVSFSLKTYIPGDNGDYKGVGISCGVENGDFKITLIEYENNDISADPVKFSIISKNEFFKLCSEKYERDNLIYIENETRRTILQMYADKVSEDRKKAAEKMWEAVTMRTVERTSKEREMSKFGVVFSDIDIMDDNGRNKGIKNLAAEYRKSGFEPGE